MAKYQISHPYISKITMATCFQTNQLYLPKKCMKPNTCLMNAVKCKAPAQFTNKKITICDVIHFNCNEHATGVEHESALYIASMYVCACVTNALKSQKEEKIYIPNTHSGIYIKQRFSESVKCI